MNMKFKRALTICLALSMVLTCQAMFTSCGNAFKFKDSKVIILDKTEEQLREVYSGELHGVSDAWVGKYILSGKPYPDRAKKTSLGSLDRQYYKITEKVFDLERNDYTDINIPKEAIYAVPTYIYRNESKTPLFINGITLFELELKCLQDAEDEHEVLKFNLEEQEIKNIIEDKLGASYAWETFNKFEIEFVEEFGEEFFWFTKKAFSRKAKAIWSTEYKGCVVENRLEVTLQFADIDDEKGLVFRENTSIEQIEYTNAFLYSMGRGKQPDLFDMKIDIPNEKTLLKLFKDASAYVPNLEYENLDFSSGLQITSYEGYPCIYCPVVLDDGTHAPDKVVSMIIFI